MIKKIFYFTFDLFIMLNHSLSITTDLLLYYQKSHIGSASHAGISHLLKDNHKGTDYGKGQLKKHILNF